MKNKFALNLLSSGLQSIAVQVLGAGFFYIISLYLSKDDFGVFGWSNSVSMLLVTVLGFGLEQVVVRRIAAASGSEWTAGAFFLHAFVGSAFMLAVLYLLHFLFGDSPRTRLLPLFFGVQAITYLAVPLKQFLNARGKFAPYGIIAIISNLSKIVLVFVFLPGKILTISIVLAILFITAMFELVALGTFLVTRRSMNFNFKFRAGAYKMLLKEAFPQYLSVLFDSSLNRIDWILLGIMSTTAITADYSFAYRAYEFTKLPLLILGPVLLNKYSRVMASQQGLDENKKSESRRLLTLEIFVAGLVLLIANTLWTPVVMAATKGKYGASNAHIFLLLSLCLPLHFFINLLWTLGFAAKKYAQLSKITMVTAFYNLGCNLLLIPFLGGTGAAIAYLSATVLQAIIYYRLVKKTIMFFPLGNIVKLFLLAVGGYICAFYITPNTLLRVVVAILLFSIASVLLRLVSKRDAETLLLYLKK